ncbi:MAG: hypothetical protein ACI9SY_000550 [Candidatus Paceibacteria bacterium]|jgi:hypothetical protein
MKNYFEFVPLKYLRFMYTLFLKIGRVRINLSRENSWTKDNRTLMRINIADYAKKQSLNSSSNHCGAFSTIAV